MQPGRRELFGDVVRTLDLPHFHVTETKYGAHTRLPLHKHSRSYLSLVIRGAYQEVYFKGTEECLPGTVIFHPAEEVHENIFPASEATCLNLHLRFQDQNFHSRNRIYHSRGLAVALFKKIHRELCNPDSFSSLIMDGLALQLLGEVLRVGCEDSKVPRWLKQVEEHIHSSFDEKLTMASLAASAGVHPVHLSRTFHKHYHCTVGEYLRSVRMDFASRKLCTTNLEICEIAQESGFSDQSAFAKNF